MHVSALPSLLACPSSQLPTDHPYDPPSDAGELGSATHDALADVVMEREPDVPALAKAFGVKERDLGPLVAYGRMAWHEVKDQMPAPRIEHRLLHPTLDLSGRADVLSIDDDGDIAILDWKTNRERKDYRPQLLGYAACASELYGLGTSGVVKTFTVWIRLGEIDCGDVTAADLSRFAERVAWARRTIGERYTPGEACTYCRRQLVCEARHEYIRSAAVALQPMGAGMQLNPVVLPRLYRQAQLLGKALRQYNDALRMVLATDGAQTDGQGGTLDLVTRGRDDIDPREAWAILTDEGFSDDELAACASLSSGAVYDVIASKAPKGRKGKERARLKERLREAGAINRHEYQTIQLTKGTSDVGQ